jgi:hypothetical protein
VNRSLPSLQRQLNEEEQPLTVSSAANTMSAALSRISHRASATMSTAPATSHIVRVSEWLDLPHSRP